MRGSCSAWLTTGHAKIFPGVLRPRLFAHQSDQRFADAIQRRDRRRGAWRRNDLAFDQPWGDRDRSGSARTAGKTRRAARAARDLDAAPRRQENRSDTVQPGLGAGHNRGASRRTSIWRAASRSCSRRGFSIRAQNTPAASNTPMITKATAATRCVSFGSSNLPARLPTKTASAATDHSARLEASRMVSHA